MTNQIYLMTKYDINKNDMFFTLCNIYKQLIFQFVYIPKYDNNIAIILKKTNFEEVFLLWVNTRIFTQNKIFIHGYLPSAHH